MYSQTEVIFGVPITEELLNFCDDWDQLQNYGFTILYHGGSDFQPGYYGISLCQFNECSLYTSVDSLVMSPNATQRDEVYKMIDTLPKEVKELLPEIGVYFIHYSS